MRFLVVLLLAALPARCEPEREAALRRSQQELGHAKAVFERLVQEASTACGALLQQQRAHPDPEAEDAFPEDRVAAFTACDTATAAAAQAREAADKALERYGREAGLLAADGASVERKGRSPALAVQFTADLRAIRSNLHLRSAGEILEDERGTLEKLARARERSRRTRGLAAGASLLACLALGGAWAFRRSRRSAGGAERAAQPLDEALAQPPSPARPPAPAPTPVPRQTPTPSPPQTPTPMPMQTPAPATAPAAPSGTPLPRVLGGGQFRVLGESTGDVLGPVLKAEDAGAGKGVVIRAVRDELHQDARDLDVLLEKARKLTRLRHPGIVEVRWVFVENERVHLVMEATPGPTLATRLKAGPIRLAEALHVMRETLYALEYAHSLGFVHGNLCPLSILADPEGTVKVRDFGIGLEAAKAASRLAWKGAVQSEPYMAPEQELGRVDPASDIFSAGVILYEMTTGTLPFPGPDFLPQKRSRSFRPASSAAPALPKKLDLVLSRALEPEPGARQPGAAALLDAIEDAAG